LIRIGCLTLTLLLTIVRLASLGHSLGLQHSNEDDRVYGDRTGAMSNGLGLTSTRMCFNIAHSWYLGWYFEKRIALNLSKRGAFEGSLIGIDDYKNPLADTRFVTIKIENGLTDYFLGFNVAKGINVDTGEYQGEVLLIEQEGNEPTVLVETFKEAGEYTISNYQGLGKKLRIKIIDVDLDADPPNADVKIHLDGCEPGVCKDECNVCCENSHCKQGDACVVGTCAVTSGICEYDTTGCPGKFEFTVNTDDWPDETSFELVDNCKGAVVLSRVGYPKKGRTYTDLVSLRRSHYSLKVFDRIGDGMCCDTGRGSYIATLDGLSIFDGGDFGSVDIHTFSNLPSGSSFCPVDDSDEALDLNSAGFWDSANSEVAAPDGEVPEVVTTSAPVPKPTIAPPVPVPTKAPVPAPTIAPIGPTPINPPIGSSIVPVSPPIPTSSSAISQTKQASSSRTNSNGQQQGSEANQDQDSSNTKGKGDGGVSPQTADKEDDELDEEEENNDDDTLVKVQDAVKDNMMIIIGSAAGVGVCFLFCVVFAFCTHRRRNSATTSRVAGYQAVPTRMQKSPMGGYNAIYTKSNNINIAPKKIRPRSTAPKKKSGPRRGRPNPN
jgi:hypothetical protein